MSREPDQSTQLEDRIDALLGGHVVSAGQGTASAVLEAIRASKHADSGHHAVDSLLEDHPVETSNDFAGRTCERLHDLQRREAWHAVWPGEFTDVDALIDYELSSQPVSAPEDMAARVLRACEQKPAASDGSSAANNGAAPVPSKVLRFPSLGQMAAGLAAAAALGFLLLSVENANHGEAPGLGAPLVDHSGSGSSQPGGSVTANEPDITELLVMADTLADAEILLDEDAMDTLAMLIN